MFSNEKEMSLDIVLKYAQRNQILTVKASSGMLKGCHFPYDNQAVVVGRFAFQVHCHDTGNSVTGYILTDDKPYMIIRATFWKRSGYEHNKDTWERGRWDEALREAISTVKLAASNHRQDAEDRQRLVENAKAVEAMSEKSKVQALFS